MKGRARELAAMIEAGTRRLRLRVSSLIARAVLDRIEEGDLQTVQMELLAGEVRRFPRVQEYGFNSLPLEGAEPAVVVCPHGDRTQAVAIAVDDRRHRPQDWSPGDAGLYDSRGNVVRLRDGAVEITAAEGLEISVTGDATLNVSGAVTITAASAVTVSAPTVNVAGSAAVNLAGGGAPVARVGDPVAGGVITGGSSKVFAG